MFAAKITSIALMAILSNVAVAGPTNPVAVRQETHIDTSDWVPVKFQGKILKYNPAALNTSVVIHNPPGSDGGDMSTAVITNDCCGGSSFSGTASPWPTQGDCAVIRDWAYTLNTYWSIWTNTPDYHGVIVYGTCVFGAGTRNVYDTYVGSSDMADLVRDGINRFANNGLVGAAGEMGCENSCTQSGCPFSGRSSVFWKLQRA
ncbi:Putative Ecp2 effector protein [Colletotrichum destructivum]|uniref:Ecp2 effector protein n=1 Tax=Colletotrichum destructivum TaxID=34406 RepID=A0AAX4I6K4_9PEZI|nr:Putative Ecp2 effector protein [Colletotrichum destructivum]